MNYKNQNSTGKNESKAVIESREQRGESRILAEAVEISLSLLEELKAGS